MSAPHAGDRHTDRHGRPGLRVMEVTSTSRRPRPTRTVLVTRWKRALITVEADGPWPRDAWRSRLVLLDGIHRARSVSGILDRLGQTILGRNRSILVAGRTLDGFTLVISAHRAGMGSVGP